MPSVRTVGLKVDVIAFDVIGTDGERQGFIRHTGLASVAGEHDRRAVPVIDMAPPLRRPGKMEANVVGTANLTDDEAHRVKDFVDRHEGEHRAIQKLNRLSFPQVYCVLPHAAPFNEADGRYVRMRFSCAGFVFEAYKRAGIHLVEERQLPPIELQRIKEAYPDHAPLLDRPDFRDLMGLTGPGPWPVMLCGYLLNATKRDAPAIRREPHVAKTGDEIFQSRE
ncbi:MAG: hypothetical protein ABSH20_06860 [Tepidisphaeraceae bacterium]|jgi:hypothetical protein